MTRIVSHPDQLAQLTDGRAEFVDAAGNVVGHLTTDDSFAKLVTVLFPEPTPEELAQARAEMLATGGASITEIREAIESARRKWEAL